jgi:peptidyl-prolyl cis-trans isomerase D
MFDFVHTNKKIIQIVLGIMLLPFAFWGIESYRKSGGGDALATVNGEKISQQEFDNALRQQQARMREMMGNKFDQAEFDTPETRHAILENMVSQRLLAIQAISSGLTATDEQLARVIAGIEAFQKDGKFDKEQYESVLRAQNMTPLVFEARVRQELGMRQLTDAYSQNGYASTTVMDNLIRLNEQQRVVSVTQVSADSYLKDAKVSDAAIKEYYDKNTTEFQVPDEAKAEYVVLSADGLMSQLSVDDTEIRKYYDEHQTEFGTPEQRHAAHILITVSAQASDADKAAARAKADDVLKQVRQSPNKFAELARQYSQDPGSAANGGDLGMFGHGVMVKPFDDAVFQLKPGEISGLVQSEFGFHIIKLLDIQAAKIRPLNDVKAEISTKIKQQKAADKFAELADKFSNVAYEQSDSLKAVADIARAPIQQSAWLKKGQPAVAPWTDKALAALFSKEVVQDKRNSSVTEVAPNALLVSRVAEYKPASTLPLATVTEVIRQKLARQAALETAYKEGSSLLEQLKKGEHPKLAWKPAETMTRVQAGHGNDLVRAVFQADASKLPAYVGIEDKQSGYMLARIDEVKDIGAIDDNKRARYMQELRKLTGEEMLQAYVADAKKNANISFKAASEKK